MDDVMDINLDSLNLQFNDAPSGGGGSSGSGGFSTSAYGPGVELLMNKPQGGFQTSSSAKDLGNFASLDKQIDELTGGSSGNVGGAGGSGGSGSTGGNKSGGFLGGLFSGWGAKDGGIQSAKDVERATQPDVGSYARPAPKTWDGFTKTNELPSGKPLYDSKQMTEKEKRVKKRKMIAELERWAEKGYIKDRAHFHRDSPYEEVEEEYDTVFAEMQRNKSVEWQKSALYAFMSFLENANGWVDPFGIQLEGLTDKTMEELDSYEEIFGELHDKWKGGKFPPELALVCKVSFTIAMLHFSNKLLSQSPLQFQDVIKNNPELKKVWTESVAKSLADSEGNGNGNGGMGFIADILKNRDAEEAPSMRYGAPPATLDPRTLSEVPKNGNRPPPMTAGRGMNFTSSANSRPDLAAAGVSLSNYGEVGVERPRPEMRGPRQNINELLSGLKVDLPPAFSGAGAGAGAAGRPAPVPYNPPLPVPPPTVNEMIDMSLGLGSGGNGDEGFEQENIRMEVGSIGGAGDQSGAESGYASSEVGFSLHESVMSTDDMAGLSGVSKRRRRKPAGAGGRTAVSKMDFGNDLDFGSGLDLGVTDI
jgi:hypothetical protein